MTPKVRNIVLFTVLGKLVLMSVFSSGYQDELFVPFVTNFLQEGGNPWGWVESQNLDLEFPYPPLMLYVLSFFLSPALLFDSPHPLFVNFLTGIPVIICDTLIFILLVRQFPWRKTEIYLFYFISPIIIFSTFVHRQLDIIPSALLFLSCFLLAEKKYFWSSVVVGLAVATKFHVVALMPLIFMYLLQKQLYRHAMLSVVVPVATYVILAFPFIFDDAYIHMVLQNPKQQGLFESFYTIGNVKIYLPLLVVSFIYMQQLAYNKVNIDLFFALVGTLFSVFLALIVPSPGWYVWIMPYLTIFFIRYFEGSKSYILYTAISLLYLNYFVLFHEYDHQSIKFFGENVNIQLLSVFSNGEKLRDISFTLLEAALFMIILLFYINGIRSNRIYSMSQSFVIGIGGDSGAGKTTLLSSLSSLMGKLSISIEGDGDHRWDRHNENWKTYTHLNPIANLLHSQAAHLKSLKYGTRISRMDYNHSDGKFQAMDNVKPKDFLLFSGLHAFYLPRMRSTIDLKIFLGLDEGLRRKWKIERDTLERGKNEKDVLAALDKREEDSKKYIHPQESFADIVIKYYSLDEKNLGDDLGLSVKMDANVSTEEIVDYLAKENVIVKIAYCDDLKFQSLSLESPPVDVDFQKMSKIFIVNQDELVDEPNWKSGYEGFLQFLVMYIISLMKQEEAENV